jgi:SlyX protein
MSDPRLDEIEARYSLLEKTVQELSDVIWRQQQELDALRQLTHRLRDRLEADPGLVDATRADRPPHY